MEVSPVDTPQIFINQRAVRRLENMEDNEGLTELTVLQEFVDTAQTNPGGLLEALNGNGQDDKANNIVKFFDQNPEIYKAIDHDPETRLAVNTAVEVEDAHTRWLSHHWSDSDETAEYTAMGELQKARAAAFLSIAVRQSTPAV